MDIKVECHASKTENIFVIRKNLNSERFGF